MSIASVRIKMEDKEMKNYKKKLNLYIQTEKMHCWLLTLRSSKDNAKNKSAKIRDPDCM